MQTSADLDAYRALLAHPPKKAIGVPTTEEPWRVPARAWVSDRLSIIRSLLLAIVFKGSAWLHFNAGSDDGAGPALKDCWSEKLPLWSKRVDREKHSLVSDSQAAKAWMVLSPHLQQRLDTRTPISKVKRVIPLRNTCAHVGFHDIEADSHLATLLDEVSRALLGDLERIEAALTPDQLRKVGRFRTSAHETLPILRSTRYPPAWPHPRLEWWGWSPRERQRSNRVVSPSMPLFGVYFPSLANTRKCGETEHNLPPAPRPHEPRTEVIEALDVFWSHPFKGSHLLVGHGGIGKTAEALNWAWDLMKNDRLDQKGGRPSLILFQSHKQDFYSEYGLERVLDTKAEDAIDSLARRLVEVLREAGSLAEGDESRGPMQILEETKTDSEKAQRRLVILDNCETMAQARVESARDVFSRHAKVLLTSRNSKVSGELTRVAKLEDGPTQNVLLDLVKPHLSAEEFGEGVIDRLVDLADGRPLLLHAAVGLALQEPGDSLARAIELHLDEMHTGSAEGLVEFLAESGWKSLDDAHRLLVVSLYRLAQEEDFEPIGAEKLQLLLRCTNDHLELRLNLDSLYDWLEKRPDLFQLLPSARGDRSLIIAWGLRGWLERGMVSWAETLELTPGEYQTIGLIEQTWERRTGSRLGASERTFLGYLQASLTREEARWLAGTDRVYLLENPDVMTERDEASPGLILYASWLELDQITTAPPDSIRERIVSILESDPTHPWARATLGRFYFLQARSEVVDRRTGAALSEGWRQFDAAQGERLVRLHVELARLDAISELLDARPELVSGQPDEPKDHLVLTRSSGERQNLMDATRTVESRLKKGINEARQQGVITRDQAEALRSTLRQTMANIGWRGSLALEV